MQSEPTSPSAAPGQPNRPPRKAAATFAVVVFGTIPVCGLAAELGTGSLSSHLPLFPTWWHVGLVVLAVVMNFQLHLGVWQRPQHLVARAVAIGSCAGMAALYGLAELPALPFMVFLSIVGLGILAAAPYWTLLGMLRLVPDLVRDWGVARRSPALLVGILVGFCALPTTWTLWSMRQAHAERHQLVQLADAMRDPARAEEVERLAVSLRGGDRDLQRAFCVDGGRGDDEEFGVLGIGRVGDRGLGRRFPHLADGQPFWFQRWFDRRQTDAAAARVAFHRVHGVGWNDSDEALPQFGWRGGEDVDWLSSRIEVHPEPDAALARVDWQLEVTAHSDWLAEARFDLRLPPQAVASSLSSWIEGQERPAAFAARGKVQAAYDAVVAKQRDPALLQELTPGLVRLLLFPLSQRLPAMRVRVGFTVPLRTVESSAELWLPSVVSHSCRHGRVAEHDLVVMRATGPERRSVTDAELQQPLVFARGAEVVQTVDHDGVVVQRLAPRPANAGSGPFVVVLEASHTVHESVSVAKALFGAFRPDAKVVLFVAHGAEFARCEAAAGSAELAAFVDARPGTGGVDARPALQAALDEAVRIGVREVVWLHGAAAARYPRSWPTFPDGVGIAALALHPGRNVVREEWLSATQVVDVARWGDHQSPVDALREHLAFGAGGIGDRVRTFERRRDKLPDVVEVSDQLARLWAAAMARAQVATDPGAASRLAARYRLVTAGSGAVVLESQAQYVAAGLEPGALLGREPEGPIGGAPVPEWSTWLSVACGLAVLTWWGRRRSLRA
ncbi:MAG: hypothetical protein JNK15_19405 [Planctomycetes bacterium]|nr:hypothetical protein [Planctomycetota bacterium]